MAQPLAFTPLIVPNGGINETASPQQIADNQWSAGTNVEPMPDGVRRRYGSVASNATALSGAIQAIIDFIFSDGSTQRHLVMAAGKLYRNVTGTMTEATHAAGTLATSADMHPSWTIGNDRVFFTDNSSVARKYYVNGTFTYHENEGIAAPTATATLGTAADTVNGLATGTWYLDFAYWNNDIGIQSDSRYLGAASLSQVIAASEALTVAALPTATIRTGDRATHVRLYTRAPSGSVFRYTKQVALGTATATITATDVPTTELETDHAVSPVHKIKCVAENRQFILNVATHPYRLMFSAIIGTTPYYESFPANNFRDFGKGDGDYGTALFFVPPRTLVVGFKNSIWAIDPREPGTSDRFKIAENIGIANHHAGVVVGRTLYFVSDAAKNKGMFSWTPGEQPQLVRGIDDTFKSLVLSRLDNCSCSVYAPDEERHQWWTLITGSGAVQDRVLVYDYDLQAWTVYSLGVPGGVLGAVEESGVSKMYVGGTDGKEYLMDVSSATADGTVSFNSSVSLKAFDYGHPGENKRLRFVDYLAKEQTVAAPGAMSLQIQRDYRERTDINVPLAHDAPSGSLVWGTGVWGTATWGSGGSDKYARVSARGRAKVFKPTISGPSNWFIKGLVMAAQLVGKR